MSLNKNVDSPNAAGSSKNNNNEDSSARSRLRTTILLFSLVIACLYLWGAENVTTYTSTAEFVVQRPTNKNNETTSSSSSSLPPTQAITSPLDAATETLPPIAETIATSGAAATEIPKPQAQGTPSSSGAQGTFDTGCSDVCTKREANRKEKFGGDLLDFQDIVKLAKAGHDKVEAKLREDYGEYYDRMFKDGTNPDGGTHFYGMKPATPDGPSRARMKRKMKIKVLKMMASVKATESNVHGCDCIGKEGSVNAGVDEDTLTAIPEFYEKYVFANGGHSNAAGHGNMYSEAYTAVFGRDVRPIWEAIGIEMIDRNYAMGAMSATPFISLCAKEIFGTDVDFLAWNYGMTDPGEPNAAYYVYRGALIPSHPAIVFVSAKHGYKIAKVFEGLGLAMFDSKTGGTPAREVPEMMPNGVPLSDEEAKKIPLMARNLKCKGRLEGKDLCFKDKFSCRPEYLKAGVDCICPDIGKRVSWHMGYRMHALEGHLIALPFIEMLLEALKELAASAPNDSEQLLADLQKEEDEDFKQFMESPLAYSSGFKTLESNKTGDVAIYTHETYDTGGFYFSKYDGAKYLFVNEEPPAGKFSIIAGRRERSGAGNIRKFEKECGKVVMPDYKDSFYAPLLDGKASVTFPNEKEKEYYGYDPKLFKGVVVLVVHLFAGEGTDLVAKHFFEGKFTMTVNSKPVRKITVVNSKAYILKGDDGSPFWEPDPQTRDYTIEFTVAPEVRKKLLRFGNFVLM